MQKICFGMKRINFRDLKKTPKTFFSQNMLYKYEICTHPDTGSTAMLGAHLFGSQRESSFHFHHSGHFKSASFGVSPVEMICNPVDCESITFFNICKNIKIEDQETIS